MDMDLIFSVISWIAGTAVVLLLCVPFFLAFLFVFVPRIGFTQFYNVDMKDVEETILNNQLKRLLKVTGMTFPPYTARFQEPVTDLNGSFYGMIHIEFKELLKDDFLAELGKRIKEADPCSLWKDRKLRTTLIITLQKDRHYMYLKYRRIYPGESKHGGFKIRDERNIQPLEVKSFEETFGVSGGFGGFAGFSAEKLSQESGETTQEMPKETPNEHLEG